MPAQIHPEIEELKHEIQSLKLLLLNTQHVPKKIVSLKGMLKGVKVSDEEIQKAKKSVFKFSAQLALGAD